MSGWIKFWKDMPNDPRVLSAAMELSRRYVLARKTAGGGADLTATESCNAWRNAVTGALATLWAYADEHIRDDDTLPLTSQTVDAIVGLEGFFDAMPREWIDELDDGSIILPGYCEKNSLIAKRKRTIKSNARVTQWRRANKTNGNAVTSGHVTQHSSAGDLDQDKDQDLRSKRVPSEPVERGSTDAVGRVFEHWQTTHGHPKAALDDKRRKKIREALKHYSEADLCQAITGYLNSPHHAGQNANGTVYDDITLLLRDSTHIDAGLRFYAQPPQPKSKAHQAQSANVSAGLAFLARSSQ
jgi:hypothetical protein